MLPSDQWEAVLQDLVGAVHRGTERLRTAAIMDALGVEEDRAARAKVAKRIVPRMRALGWRGPKSIRWEDGTYTNGYWKFPHALPRVVQPPALVLDDALDGTWGNEEDLPRELLGLLRGSMKDIRAIQRLPIDEGNGVLLRAKTAAAQIVFNAQLRADEQQLRRRTQTDVLDRLLKLIEEEQERRRRPEEKKQPPKQPTEQVEMERSDAEASVMLPDVDGSEEGH